MSRRDVQQFVVSRPETCRAGRSTRNIRRDRNWGRDESLWWEGRRCHHENKAGQTLMPNGPKVGCETPRASSIRRLSVAQRHPRPLETIASEALLTNQARLLYFWHDPASPASLGPTVKSSMEGEQNERP